MSFNPYNMGSPDHSSSWQYPAGAADSLAWRPGSAGVPDLHNGIRLAPSAAGPSGIATAAPPEARNVQQLAGGAGLPLPRLAPALIPTPLVSAPMTPDPDFRPAVPEAAPRGIAQEQQAGPRVQQLIPPGLSDVEKCAAFFKTLLKLADRIRPAGDNMQPLVRNLVQDLICEKRPVGDFVDQVQVALKSNAQPHLRTFLERTMPEMRAALKSGAIRIPGISVESSLSKKLSASGATTTSASPAQPTISCPICFDNYEQIIKGGRRIASTTCGHLFCNTCMIHAFEARNTCPICRIKLTEDQIHILHF